MTGFKMRFTGFVLRWDQDRSRQTVPPGKSPAAADFGGTNPALPGRGAFTTIAVLQGRFRETPRSRRKNSRIANLNLPIRSRVWKIHFRVGQCRCRSTIEHWKLSMPYLKSRPSIFATSRSRSADGTTIRQTKSSQEKSSRLSEPQICCSKISARANSTSRPTS
jgi:hypothetical protein